MKQTVAVVLSLLFAAGCSHYQKHHTEPPRPAPETLDISLMTFNVENLFDTTHDTGKNDYTFLPLSKKQTKFHKNFCGRIKVEKWKNECLNIDWTEEKLKDKMRRLALAVKQVNNGKGPDVLFLQEVENKKILERFNKEALGSLYSEVLLIEGADLRGIDVAIMSKLPLVKPAKLHSIPFVFDDPKRAEDTRGILEAQFRLPDGQTLVAYSLHLPNPMHPAVLREQALDFLTQLASEHKDKVIVAAGDFNITSEEEDREKRTTKYSKNWLISHVEGCKHCQGTSYYAPKDNWSFLDWMMFSKNLSESQQGWFLDKASITTHIAYDAQKDDLGRPVSFSDVSVIKGVSDHYPVGAVIKKIKSSEAK